MKNKLICQFKLKKIYICAINKILIKNYFFKFVSALGLFFIVIGRRVRFRFEKSNEDDDFIKVCQDHSFKNSLIKIDFYFEQLLYIDFPQIGKKIHNGRIVLNSDRLNFPYDIEIVTYNKSFQCRIEMNNASNQLISESLSVQYFDSFDRIFNKIYNFKMPQLAITKPNLFDWDTANIEFVEKNKFLKINHKTFKKQEYL